MRALLFAATAALLGVAVQGNTTFPCTPKEIVNVDLVFIATEDGYISNENLPVGLENWMKKAKDVYRSVRVGVGRAVDSGYETSIGLTPNATLVGSTVVPQTAATRNMNFLEQAVLAQSGNTLGWPVLPSTNAGGYRTLRVVLSSRKTGIDSLVIPEAPEEWRNVLDDSDAYAAVLTESANAAGYEAVGAQLGTHRVVVGPVNSLDADSLKDSIDGVLGDILCKAVQPQEYTPENAVDMLFAVDNTVSMRRFGSALQSALPAVVATFQGKAASVAPGLVSFNDKPTLCDAHRAFAPENYCSRVESSLNKTSADSFTAAMQNISYIYGDRSSREDVNAALSLATKMMWHEKALKYLVVVSDALPHNTNDDFACGATPPIEQGNACASAPYENIADVCRTLNSIGVRVLYVTTNSQAKAQANLLPGCETHFVNALSNDPLAIRNAIVSTIENEDMIKDRDDGFGGDVNGSTGSGDTDAGAGEGNGSEGSGNEDKGEGEGEGESEGEGDGEPTDEEKTRAGATIAIGAACGFAALGAAAFAYRMIYSNGNQFSMEEHHEFQDYDVEGNDEVHDNEQFVQADELFDNTDEIFNREDGGAGAGNRFNFEY